MTPEDKEVEQGLDPYHHHRAWVGVDCPPCARRSKAAHTNPVTKATNVLKLVEEAADVT